MNEKAERESAGDSLAVFELLEECVASSKNEIARLRAVLEQIAEETTIQPGTFDEVMNGTGVLVPTRSAKLARDALVLQ